jgi:hypothetical protein
MQLYAYSLEGEDELRRQLSPGEAPWTDSSGMPCSGSEGRCRFAGESMPTSCSERQA